MKTNNLNIKRILIFFIVSMLIVIVYPMSEIVSAAIEDLTTYDEQDDLNRLSYNTTKVTITSMRHGDNNIHLTRNWAGQSVLDFVIEYEFYVPTVGNDGRGNICVTASFSNTLNDLEGSKSNIFAGFYCRNLAGAPVSLMFGEWDIGTKNHTIAPEYITENHLYYAWFNRTGTTLTYEVYSDATRTTLVKSLTKTVNDTGYSYFYVAQSIDNNLFENNYVSWYNQNYEITASTTGGAIPGAPTNGVTTYTPPDTINLTWSKGIYANNTVIVMKTTGYPSNRTDGEVWYNGTDTWYDNTSLTSGVHYYIRGWSENYWSNPDSYTVSTSYFTFAYGDITINCYDENTTNNITSWGIHIRNSDGSQNYYNYSASNTLYLDVTQIPYGEDTVFIFNATDYSSRVYIMDIAIGNIYTINAFLSNDIWTNLYYITVTDQRDQSINDATVTILKFINGSFENISILKTNGYGQVFSHLQIGFYMVKLEATGYITSYNNYETDSDFYGLYYPTTFKMLATNETPIVYTFEDLISFTVEWQTNNTLGIIYNDNSESTLTLDIDIYETNGTAETLENSYSYTSNCNAISLYVSGLNQSNTHIVKISNTHSLLGSVENYTLLVFPIRNYTIDTTDLEQQLTDGFGDFDLGYINMFIIWAPGIIILLGLASVNHPGFGIIGMGLWSAIASSKIETNLDENLFILFSLLVLLGIIALLLKKRGGWH